MTVPVAVPLPGVCTDAMSVTACPYPAGLGDELKVVVVAGRLTNCERTEEVLGARDALPAY